MNLPEGILLLYVVPAIICILFSWLDQLLGNLPEDEKFFGAIAVVPVANIFGAGIGILMLVGFLCAVAIQLPTIIKELLK